MASSSMTQIAVQRNPSYVPNGLKSYAYALNKYKIKATQPECKFSWDHAQSKLMKEENGNRGVVTADDIMKDAFYTCPVQIGTPAQTLNLDFDSGSSDLWLLSTTLDKDTLAAVKEQGNEVFDHKKSTSFRNQEDYTWRISYGDGSGASGIVGKDTVRIGGISVEKQVIELATEVSSSFQNQKSSGLLGLAYGVLNTVKPQSAKTPVENMILQKDITNKIWSVYLGSVKDVKDPDHGKSFYTFGSYDKSVVEASGQDIAWTPYDSSTGWYMFSSTSVSINGKILELSGNRAMADTGTTLMLVSDEFCKALYSAIDGAKFDRQSSGWIIPGNSIDKRPEVKVAVGDAMITIEKEQLGWADLNDGSGMVFGAIQSRGENTFDIFGDTFLICCYAIFDVAQERFGVVQRADPTPAGQ